MKCYMFKMLFEYWPKINEDNNLDVASKYKFLILMIL